MPLDGLVDDGRLQIIEDVVVVPGGFSAVQQLTEFFLQRLPTHLHALAGQGNVGPLLQLNVGRGVERT